MVFFSEGQRKFQQSIRGFVGSELSKGAEDRARLDHIIPEIIVRIAKAGLLEFGTTLYAKRRVDNISIGILFEEVCKVDFTLMIVLLSQYMIYQMAEWMSPELRKDLLPATASGRKLLCFANTEPDCGSDAAAIRTEAIRDHQSYIINGEKTSISCGMQADAVIMTAKTDPKAGVKGITLFYIPLDLEGVIRSRFTDMGNESAGRASLIFDEVRIPLTFRIGNEGEGFVKVMRTFDASRVFVAISALALAEACLEETVRYVKSKKSFGYPMGQFESVSFRVAEHATKIEAARLLCYEALKLKDENALQTKEASMAKWFAPACAVEAIHDLLIIFGHTGYSRAYSLEQRWRDAFSCLIGDGTEEIMKLVVAREILGKEFLLAM